MPRINQNLRTWLGNVSYVTGAHSFKAGYSHTWAKSEQLNADVNQNLGYQFNRGVPTAIFQRATPYLRRRLRDERRAGPLRAGPVDRQQDDRELPASASTT